MLSPVGEGSRTAVFKTNTSLLPLTAFVFLFFEAWAGESLLRVSLFLDLLDYFPLAAGVPAEAVLLPLLDGTFPSAGI